VNTVQRRYFICKIDGKDIVLSNFVEYLERTIGKRKRNVPIMATKPDRIEGMLVDIVLADKPGEYKSLNIPEGTKAIEQHNINLPGYTVFIVKPLGSEELNKILTHMAEEGWEYYNPIVQGFNEYELVNRLTEGNPLPDWLFN
jgi:hypothetical protein